ncbi:MAG: RluA family pseudouridine synthase [Planctomycetota bacterium]
MINHPDGDASSTPVRTLIVSDDAAGTRLDLYLAQSCDGYSRSQIRDAVQAGAAQIDGRVVRPSFKVKAGQEIRFHVPPPAIDETIPENIPLDILFEDDGMIVVNKPPGMVVHPARGHWNGTLTAALAFRFQSLSDVGGATRPGIVHRLDRDTSGVIVVAKTNAVHLDLSEQFAERTTDKEYFAIATTPIDRDRDLIDQPIGNHPHQRDKQAIRHDHATSRPAQTFFEVIERHGRFTLVKLSPKTGRTHQLRVHLAHIGSPILCDRLYAGHAVVTASELRGKRVSPDESPILTRQALHARRLTLTHPFSKQRMTFEAPIPDDIQAAIDILHG